MKAKYIIGVALLAISGTASSQNLSSAYFLDGFAYGHELNPAKEYDRSGYFSLPFLPSNFNFTVRGNVGVEDFLLKNPNGKGLVSYLHPSASIDDAMSNFHNNNKLLNDIRYDILSFGFHTKKAYHTVTIGLRTNFGFNMPYEIFEFSKNIENKNYDFGDMGTTAQAWVEAGYGYSRNVTEAIRVGGKFKFLVGAGYADIKMDGLRLDLSGDDRWIATANGTAEVGVKGFTWGPTETKEYSSKPGTYEQIDFDNVDVESPGIGGLGAALDLGVEWDMGKQGILDGMKLSMSLLDLGFIKWREVSTAHNNGDPFELKFDEIKIKDGEGTDIDDQFDKFDDQLSDLMSLQDGGTTKKARMLGATLNIAAEYTMPFYKHLKVGFLSTTRIQGVYSWNEEKLAATVSPVKWFELTGNIGVGTLGFNTGWVLNLHPRAFNLFVGMDYVLGKMSKQYVPLRSNANLCMGINFPLGKSRVK